MWKWGEASHSASAQINIVDEVEILLSLCMSDILKTCFGSLFSTYLTPSIIIFWKNLFSLSDPDDFLSLAEEVKSPLPVLIIKSEYLFVFPLLGSTPGYSCKTRSLYTNLG